MINSEGLRREILSDGAVDYHGLYEIVWRLNTLYPDVPESEKVKAAITVAADLLRDGFIEVFETVWASGNYTPVSAEAAPRAIANPGAWQRPPEMPATYLCFATTDSGQAALVEASP